MLAGADCDGRINSAVVKCTELLTVKPIAGAGMPSGGQNKIALTASMIQQMEKLSGFGLSRDRICDVIGISADVFVRRKKDNAVFAAAIARGRAVAESKIAECVYAKALEGDIQALKWVETTRYARTETSRQEVKQESEVTIKVVPHAD